MSLLQRLSHSHAGERGRPPALRISHALEAAVGRYEPLPLEARRAPVDPYAAWIAQLEAMRERDDRSHIRCVYRYRGTGATRSSPKP